MTSLKKIKCGDLDLFYMLPRRILAFDAVKRKTKFEKHCSLCGGYETVVGAYPPFLKDASRIGQGFFRSDIAFSWGRSKFPIFFVGCDWKELFDKRKFRGLIFQEVVT